jgi:ornithine--oxo-acid transaminase
MWDMEIEMHPETAPVLASPNGRPRSASLDVGALYSSLRGSALDVAGRHFNPSFVQALRLLGLDREYVRAEGCWLEDAAGQRYLDFLCGFRVLSLGHNHRAVKQAIAEAALCGWPNMHQMDVSPLAARLAEMLVQRATPGLEIVRFGNSGAEAVEMAMKFARRATGRARLVAARDGYHGLTYGALSLSGRPDLWQNGFAPMLSSCVRVPFNDVRALERELEGGDVAAFIVEPIQGEAGIVVPDDDYLPRAQELCRKYGALFVLDEIQTGLGRTGRFLAAEHWSLEPDMVCLAKALSGGFVPVSATLMRREIADRVFGDMENCAIHFSTFEANNLAMVAGIATLQAIDDEHLVDNSRRMGDLLLDRLRELASRHEFIADVRGKGLFAAVRFGVPRSLKAKLAWKLAEDVGDGFFGEAIVMALMTHHRVLAQVAGHDPYVLDCTPPLVVTEPEIECFVTALDDVLTRSAEAPGLVADMAVEMMRRSLELGVPLPELHRSAPSSS